MIRSRFWRSLGIFFGCLISSSSINLFLLPNHLLSGGLAGISIIVYFLTGLPVGVQTLVYNIPLFLAAYKTLGWKYTEGVVFSTVLFSVGLDATHFLNGFALVPDPMLAAIFGGVFNGLGCSFGWTAAPAAWTSWPPFCGNITPSIWAA